MSAISAGTATGGAMIARWMRGPERPAAAHELTPGAHPGACAEFGTAILGGLHNEPLTSHKSIQLG